MSLRSVKCEDNGNVVDWECSGLGMRGGGERGNPEFWVYLVVVVLRAVGVKKEHSGKS